MVNKPLIKNENDADAECDRLGVTVRRKVLASITKQRKLVANLLGDLEKHGDPETWKRYGDLLLANAGSAVRTADRVIVTDYFDESAPTIEIEGEVNKSISEIAEGYFRLYTKARNGQQIVKERINKTETSIKTAENLLLQIEAAIETRDVEFLTSLTEPKPKPANLRQKKKAETAFKGARRFMSSDGFEILVGKKAADNDYLTFRIARSLEIWMHAADYPGSHVVIRNPNKKEIPNLTLLEAAQLAAFYSSGRKQTKAAVHYTQKKFVNKPKRSASGLVSLSSFKTILVEPKIGAVTRP
ncbi:MAG: NFACT RNA binding domain-containing protein [Pyrinomonadaceae bacterium]